MTQRLTRVGVFQAAKMSGMLCFFLGIVFAGIVFLFGSALPKGSWSGMAGGFGMGMLIVLPLLYGFVAFVFGAIYAWLYNVVAGWVGGLELDLE